MEVGISASVSGLGLTRSSLRVSAAAVDREEVQGFRRALSLTKQTHWNLCHCWRTGLSDRAE